MILAICQSTISQTFGKGDQFSSNDKSISSKKKVFADLDEDQRK